MGSLLSSYCVPGPHCLLVGKTPDFLELLAHSSFTESKDFALDPEIGGLLDLEEQGCSILALQSA